MKILRLTANKMKGCVLLVLVMRINSSLLGGMPSCMKTAGCSFSFLESRRRAANLFALFLWTAAHVRMIPLRYVKAQ